MRNDPCPCGSGKKYKKCCLGREAREAKAWKVASDRDMILMAEAEGVSVEELRADFDARIAKGRRSWGTAGSIRAISLLTAFGGLG